MPLRNSKAVDRGQPVAVVSRAVRSMTVADVSHMNSADVQVGEPSDDRDQAKNETDAEADEIEGVHTIWCSV